MRSFWSESAVLVLWPGAQKKVFGFVRSLVLLEAAPACVAATIAIAARPAARRTVMRFIGPCSFRPRAQGVSRLSEGERPRSPRKLGRTGGRNLTGARVSARR